MIVSAYGIVGFAVELLTVWVRFLQVIVSRIAIKT